MNNQLLNITPKLQTERFLLVSFAGDHRYMITYKYVTVPYVKGGIMIAI